MSELLEYVKISDMKEWLERDTIRILETFPNDPMANGEEVVLFTEKMCLMVPFENIKKNYPIMWKTFREQNDLSNLICKKVEVIMCDNGGGHLGSAFKFKLTFVKV